MNLGHGWPYAETHGYADLRKGRAPARWRASLGLPLLAAALLLLTAAPAQATFHLIKVREVYPGTSDDSYVELQMFAAGQTSSSATR